MLAEHAIPALGVVFLVALGTAFFLTPLSIRLGIAASFVDHPRPGELQRRPVPRSGGYAIFVAFLLAVGVSVALFPRSLEENWRLLGFAIGALLILPLAIVDDLKRLGPGPQFVGQGIVAVTVVLFGILVDSVANPFGDLLPFPLYMAAPVTIIWVIGMINTINFIDNLDGLVPGIGLIAAAILLLRSVELGQWSIAVLPLALLGACAGFLPYNFNPARVILGTSGSMLLGYALAVLAIIGGAKIATAVMVLGLPIIDVALVIAQRTFRGRSPFRGGDAAHLPHRLMRRGWTERQIALFLYACCAIAGLLALMLPRLIKLYLFAIVIVLVIALIIALGHRIRQNPDVRASERGS